MSSEDSAVKLTRKATVNVDAALVTKVVLPACAQSIHTFQDKKKGDDDPEYSRNEAIAVRDCLNAVKKELEVGKCSQVFKDYKKCEENQEDNCPSLYAKLRSCFAANNIGEVFEKPDSVEVDFLGDTAKPSSSEDYSDISEITLPSCAKSIYNFQQKKKEDQSPEYSRTEAIAVRDCVHAIRKELEVGACAQSFDEYKSCKEDSSKDCSSLYAKLRVCFAINNIGEVFDRRATSEVKSVGANSSDVAAEPDLAEVKPVEVDNPDVATETDLSEAQPVKVDSPVVAAEPNLPESVPVKATYSGMADIEKSCDDYLSFHAKKLRGEENVPEYVPSENFKDCINSIKKEMELGSCAPLFIDFNKCAENPKEHCLTEKTKLKVCVAKNSFNYAFGTKPHD